MWNIYTMVKKNEIMKITGKWLELEKLILLSEIIQDQKDNDIHLLICGYLLLS